MPDLCDISPEHLDKKSHFGTKRRPLHNQDVIKNFYMTNIFQILLNISNGLKNVSAFPLMMDARSDDAIGLLHI